MDFSDISGLLSSAGGIADLFTNDGSSYAKKQYKLAKQQQEFLQKMALAGTDNGRGLRTYYDSATNTWKTDLSGISASLQDASNTDELKRLTLDEPRNSQARYENSIQRESMRPIIDALIGKLRNRTDITPDQLEGDMNYLSGKAYDDAYGKVQNDIASTAIRTPGAFAGRSGPNGALVAQLADAKARSAVQNRLDSKTQAASLNNNDINQGINQVNSLSANAFNFEDVPFNPQNLSEQGSAINQGNKQQIPYSTALGTQGVNAALNSQIATTNPTKWGDLGYGINGILSNFSNTTTPTTNTTVKKPGNARFGGVF